MDGRRLDMGGFSIAELMEPRQGTINDDEDDSTILFGSPNLAGYLFSEVSRGRSEITDEWSFEAPKKVIEAVAKHVLNEGGEVMDVRTDHPNTSVSLIMRCGRFTISGTINGRDWRGELSEHIHVAGHDNANAARQYVHDAMSAYDLPGIITEERLVA